MDDTADLVRSLAVLDDRVADARDVTVDETPSEVVYRENKLELRRYEPQTTNQHPTPVLVVYALINRPYILDLQPDRSVVRRLLEAGHDVYLVDWNEPSRLDRSLGLHDYVDRYLVNCVNVLLHRAGVDALNVLGYCMGGTLATIYTARYPETVNALALMATPLVVDDTGGVLETWGDPAYYDPRWLTDAHDTVPGEFLAAGFDLMDPVANAVTKYLNLAARVENEDFVENFARMERWLADSVDLAGAVYVEFLEAIYQENRLARNELVVGGDFVDVTRIDVPLLQIVGERDTLVPTTASVPFNELVGTDDATTIAYPTGHVGLAMSATAHRDLWPEVAEWFLEQSDDPALADVLGETIERALEVDVETDVTVGDVDELELVVANDAGIVASAVVHHDLETIQAFLEDALDVQVTVAIAPDDISVTVETSQGAETTTFHSIGEAIRTEVAEAVADVDVAAPLEVEDVHGIGLVYGDRLRAAGIDTVDALATAAVDDVAHAANANHKQARDWIARAGDLLERDPDGVTVTE
jgi:polyhydroxyalkanoate synthase